MVSERDAWRAYRKVERARAQYRERLKAIELEVERLQLDMEESLVRQYAEDKGFLRALKRFTGHTPHGWEVACGCDGRCKALARNLGWDAMWRIILRVRHIRNIW